MCLVCIYVYFIFLSLQTQLDDAMTKLLSEDEKEAYEKYVVSVCSITEILIIKLTVCKKHSLCIITSNITDTRSSENVVHCFWPYDTKKLEKCICLDLRCMGTKVKNVRYTDISWRIFYLHWLWKDIMSLFSYHFYTV